MATTADVLLAVAHLVIDLLDDAADGDSDAAALNLLLHNDGLSVTALAADLGLSHSAAVRVVDRLQAGGLATRRPSGQGRLLRLGLTGRGARLARQRLRNQQQQVAAALAALDATEIADLTRLLAAVGTAMVRTQAVADRACRRCDQTTCLATGCPLQHVGTAAMSESLPVRAPERS